LLYKNGAGGFICIRIVSEHLEAQKTAKNENKLIPLFQYLFYLRYFHQNFPEREYSKQHMVWFQTLNNIAIRILNKKPGNRLEGYNILF
jgi:hypothetical protein